LTTKRIASAYFVLVGTFALFSINLCTENVWADSVINTIFEMTSSEKLAFNPSNKDMYVYSYDNRVIDVINSSTNTVTRNLHPEGAAVTSLAIAFNPSNKDMYVVNPISGTM
jgi:DNA-binding beta-propeller fold protein YncE